MMIPEFSETYTFTMTHSTTIYAYINDELVGTSISSGGSEVNGTFTAALTADEPVVFMIDWHAGPTSWDWEVTWQSTS